MAQVVPMTPPDPALRVSRKSWHFWLYQRRSPFLQHSGRMEAIRTPPYERRKVYTPKNLCGYFWGVVTILVFLNLLPALAALGAVALLTLAVYLLVRLVVLYTVTAAMVVVACVL